MNILFIFPSASSKYIYVDYHHGIGLLSALVRREGHRTSLLRITRFDEKSIDRAVDAFAPDLIAYSFVSDHAALGVAVMQHLAPRRIFSVAGGVHATLAPADLIPYVDNLCLGEGEGALLELVQGKPSSGIANLWYKEEGEIRRNNLRPFLADLDSLPFSDREIFDYQQAMDQDHRADFMAGRGCPFHCAYCINNHLHQSTSGSYVRWRSVDNVLVEIKQVLNTYHGIESICFQDDTFTLKKKYLEEFCSSFKKEVGLPFVCNLRVGAVSKETVEMLADAGCIEARVGVEQGNEELRRMVLGRKMSNQQIVDTFAMIKGAGIKAFAYNMVGVPGETEATIEETIALNRQIRPDKLHVSIFHPYPGTDLYDECLTYKYFTGKKAESYFAPVAGLELPTISKKKVEYYFRIFRTAVMYPRFLPLVKLLSRIKISKRTSLYDVGFNTAYRFFYTLQKTMPAFIREPLFRMLKV
jgi:anaerobic magnesium-protoporphyrin IX monomethyl ester cyclase